MIEGLKIRMPGSKVALLALERAAEHREKAHKYAGAVDMLLAAEGEGDVPMSGDPKAGAARRRVEHERHARYFDTLAEGIVRDETYVLTEAELQRLLGGTGIY